MWGSEFTSKDAALQGGDPAETAARLNVKLRDLVTAWLVVPACYLTPYSRPILWWSDFLLNALGEVYMLLYFAPCRPLARPHRRPRQNLPCLQYSGLVSFFLNVNDGLPNSKVRALADLCAHPPRLLVADVDETVTGAFSPFLPVAFFPRPFQVQGA